MTVFEYRQSLDLQQLYKSGTIQFVVIRNQEIYFKYDAFRKAGYKKYAAIRELILRKTNYKLTERSLLSIIAQLETTV